MSVEVDQTVEVDQITVRRRPSSTPGAVALTSVSWIAERDLKLDEWLESGMRLGTVARNAKWWIGDWLRYGNTRWGERYTRAAKITGYDPHTLRNMVYVASRFDFSQRRDKLSWSHHASLAALDSGEQERLIGLAESERMSVQDLRQVVRTQRLARKREDVVLGAPVEVVTSSEPRVEDVSNGRALAAHDVKPVTCPNCGHELAEDAVRLADDAVSGSRAVAFPEDAADL